jgi:hypothetical protein
MVSGRYSLSGMHTWTLKAIEAGKRKKRVLVCNFCGAEPPTIHRAKMVEEWLRFEAEQLDQRRRMATLRKVMCG